MLEDAGVPYEENNDTSKFFEEKMDCDLYPFNQLPRLEVRCAFLLSLVGREGDARAGELMWFVVEHCRSMG
jgi:hypothetical protein